MGCTCSSAAALPAAYDPPVTRTPTTAPSSESIEGGGVAAGVPHGGSNLPSATSGISPSAFIVAAASGRVDALAAYTGDVNIFMRGNWPGETTALMAAVFHNHVDAVRALVAREGIDVNVSHGQTALHVACSWQEVDVGIVALLLEAGGDPNVRTALYGNTCLHLAARRGDVDKVDTLLGWPTTDPSLCNSAGLTPVRIAVKHNRLMVAARIVNVVRACASHECAWSIQNA